MKPGAGSHRIALPAAFAVLLCAATQARAAWNTSPGVLVTPAAAARVPQLAVSDGAGGAFVVLGGATGPAQVGVFVQHVTSLGERDAAWPDAGAQAGPAAAVANPACLPYALPQASASADGAGGVYVSWAGPPFDAASGAPTLYVQHVDASGARVAGSR